MEQNINTQHSGRGWGLILASALAAPVSALIPFALVIVPALWAYTMLRTRPAYLALFAALMLGSGLAFDTPVAAAALAALAALGALSLYILQTKRVRSLYAAAAFSAIAAACLYCAVCMPGILSGAGAFAAVQAVTDEAVAAYRVMAADAIAALPAEAAALFDETLKNVSRSVPAVVVPVLCAFSVVLGLGNFLFFRLFARNKELGLAPVRAFRLWSLPRDWTPGLLLLLAGSLVLEWIGLDYAAGVTATVNIVVGAPLAVQGLALVDYWIVRRGVSVTGRRVLAYILLGVFFALTQSFLMVLGCMEQLFRFRERGGGPFAAKPGDPV